VKKILRFILFFICLFILAEFNSGTLVNDVKDIFKAFHENVVDSTYTAATIPKDYLGLLNMKLDFEGDNTFGYKSGYPISNLIYNKEYYLHIFKLSNSFDFSLRAAIKDFFINASHSGSALLDNRSTVNYSYQSVPQDNITTVDLKLLGKQTQIIQKNDSVAYYYSQFMNFSIQYKLSDPYIIYGEPKSNSFFSNTFLPLEILFLKKNHKLYLLTMSVNSEVQTKNYPKGMLYNLIKNK